MAETKKIAFLAAVDGIEKAELVEPWAAVNHGISSAAAAV